MYMREGSPSLPLMTTALPTTRPPKPLPTRAVVCASRVLHCSLVSKASRGESLMGPPPECLSSVHITHAHSALAIADKASTVSAAITEARRSRIIALLSPDTEGLAHISSPLRHSHSDWAAWRAQTRAVSPPPKSWLMPQDMR